ncbi:TIGR02099 family protein [Caldimonas caldifontis]|uniref:TIGR02099 family protein n=1 Tax=Caldimonas caldifontis TaxID=1452508 RepID=A0A2S5SU85_9BURK|nr:TIGR02099 family protein [Caldimonas caldifontis]
MNSPVLPPRSPWPRRAGRVALRTLMAVAIGAVGLMLVAWMVMLWAILPRIDTWRAPIERAATQALGLPVQIGHIRAQSHAGTPWFEFTDVRLLDADGREALRLPQVRSTLSWSTLWHARLRLGRLELQSPELEVRRDPEGRLHVAGLGLTSGGTSASPEALDWFISLPEFLVHDGRVRWVDEQRGLPPLALDDVDAVMRNSGAGARRHEFRLDATPVAGWGERFSLRARFTQPLLTRASDRSQWSGQAYAELPRVQLRALQDHLGWPTRLDGGEGSVRAWADLHQGRWQGLTADLDLTEVVGRLDGAPEALDLAALRLRLVYQHEGEQHRLALQELSVLPRADADPSQALLSAGLPRALQAGWRREVLADGSSSLSSGEVQVPQGDLAAVAWLARRLPLGEGVQHGLAQLQPAGEVEGLRLQWHGPWQAPDRYTARGRLKGLSLAAQDHVGTGVGRPGLRGATLDFTAHERGGEAMLRIEKGAVVFPGVFDEAEVALDQLQARLDWTLTPDPSGPSVELKVSEAQFSNADAQGSFEGRWHTGADAGVGRGARLPGVLDLQGRLDRADATRVWRYLPRQLPADVRDYIRHAVMAGRAQEVDFRVRGDLWDFPYAPGQPGEFRIAAQVQDASFAYVPTRAGWTSPWPAFTHVQGELVFDRQSMHIRHARARLFGFELTGVEGGIADLAHAPVLQLSGAGTGPLADALRFINDTPVGGWTHHALADATGSGPAQLRLSLQLPLDDMERARVQGRVTLAGNDLRLRKDTPLLARTRGEVSFSDQGFAVHGATARVLGGELQFEGGTAPDGSVRFEGRGTATAEGLREVRELGPLPYLAEHLSGQAAYRMSFGVVQGWPELTLTSDLSGLASALPEPLGKPAARAWPLRVVMALDPDSLAPGRSPRDSVRVQLGQELWLHYRRALDEGSAPRVLAGAIGVGEILPLPASGVRARVVLPRLDLDRWRAVAASFEAGLDADDATPGGYAPDRVELRSPQVQAAGRAFQGVRLQGERLGDGWRGTLRADQLEGRVEWQPGANGGRLLARLSRLSLPGGASEATEALWQSEPRRPAPALDIEVEDLRWGDRRLGRVEVQATSRLTGEFHEWRLQHLRVSGPQARLHASGSWLAVRGGVAGAAPRTELDFELDVADSGELLSHWGQRGVVAGGKGRVTGQIGWQGSPLSPELASLSGQMRVDVERGRFLKADPGAARLASVLSLQALPRRFMLDFSDVFREGFVFDDFGGDVRITNGVARTENLRMRGVAAAVLMEGQADLREETQDLRVVVVPEINAGGASLVYAAINPAVGLGTFLAQLFLRKPMIEANTREFHVTGSWADPQVDPVPRQSAAPPRPAGG